MLTERRAHATLPVADLDAARTFWEGRLGFTPLEIRPTAVLYSAGAGSVFAISVSSGRASGDHTQMGFTVPDVVAEAAGLRARGIAFEEYDLPGFRTVDGVAEIGGNHAAWFKDPDGNLIGIVELGPPL
jgi:catechol 2,3-dioxygenase-like lactoylglutathione lyase family enzyme